MEKVKAYFQSKEFKSDLTVVLVLLLVIGIAVAIYFATALERDYLYEWMRGEGSDGGAYVYTKGNTMYVTSHPSFLKQNISDNFPHEWEDSITRVVIVDEIAPDDMNNWFAGMKNLKRIDGLEKLDVSQTDSFHSTFKNCVDLKDVSGIEQWDTSSATQMDYMFAGCHSLTSLDLSEWDVGNVRSMNSMFSCSGLVEIKGLENWNVESLRYASHMFRGAVRLEAIGNLNNWDLPEDFHAYRVFEDCYSLCTSDPYWAD